MKPFNGAKAERRAQREKLPAGGYIAKILDAKEVEYGWGTVLLISFDIVEGEYKDFFRKDYSAQQQEDKKWHGTYRLVEPKDDGSEKDGWTKNTFNNAIWAWEKSNSGYHWDWNEAGLKGKMVGVLFRNREWEMNGNTGWTTECCDFTDVASIRGNTFKVPKDKPLKADVKRNAAPKSNLDVDFEELEDESDLPF